MFKKATKDEDLIILSDDTSAAHSLEDITLDIPEESGDSEMITFGEPEVVLEVSEPIEEVSVVEEEEIILTLDDEVSLTEEVVVEEVEITEEVGIDEVQEIEEEKVEADFSFDLTAEDTAEEVEEVKTEQVAESTEVDFGGFDLTSESEPTGTTHDESIVSEVVAVTAGVPSMNTILEDTVAKLQARKDAIADEKSGKTAKVSHLKAEIKKLEEEVLTLEGEIEGLDQESRKITLNVEGLEDMKLGGEDIAKKHNSSRVKK